MSGFEAPAAGACVLVTGGAGFIGSHLSRALLRDGYRVAAVDCVIPYYDVRIKRRRVAELEAEFGGEGRYSFHEFNLNDGGRLRALLDEAQPAAVVHLAAQAGVRYCEQNPEEARRNNVEATRRVLVEASRPEGPVRHLLFASSSSIYGCHPRPWGEHLEPRPEGIYGTSKKTGEEMLRATLEAGTAPHLALAALRFFTVYGPHGRPDMAPAKFLDVVHRGEPVPVYGDGSAIRDFTYVEDIVQGIAKALRHPRAFEVYNLGKGAVEPASVLDLIRAIEQQLGKRARIEFSEPRAGDVPATQADISKAQRMLGYAPQFTLQQGMAATVRYYLRHVQRVPLVVAFLAPGDAAAEVDRLLASVAGQSLRPALLVVDQGSAAEQEARAALVAALPAGPLPARHLPVSASAAAWEQALEWVTSALLTPAAGEEHGVADGPSHLFVASAVAGDAFDEGHVRACMDAVGDTGAEVVATGVRRGAGADFSSASAAALATDEWADAGADCSNVFVRLDQLRRVQDAISAAEPGLEMARLVRALHKAGNVRTRGIPEATCERRC